MTRFAAALVVGAATVALSAGAAIAGPTLDAVKDRGEVACGVSTGLSGFSIPDSTGTWSGLDVDFCRAVAAAVLGDADKVKFVPLTAKERFTALQSGEIDVLSRVTTWTLTRDVSLGLNFTGVTFYDGQGFMIRKDLGVTSATELDGASVCVAAGTTTELNLADYFRLKGMEYNPVVFSAISETAQGFDSGRCDVLTSDQSQLYSLRTKLDDPESAMVLPEVISKEPLGPAVRQGDDQWFNIVKWTLFAQLNAEELGVTMDNVEDMKNADNPSIKRLVGTDGDMGEKLGLSADWAANVVAQVGNYGEMFERNVGMDTPLEIARGLNALWTAGGIQYAPPIR
ncbi:amino acid ABC transporter substrate-binding protein [Roseospira marina]|uniref:Amino acid ABC transporter substrate-binding protein n=1 Tax=Roseospira marina TaxID=140057 RepID=A0A5M6IAP1_9PROT|nr:amino acid ABC transporter substrate-binding protein [Roseospira marina]KAA5604997.1 amino acid ABC transporter substrate-binding protein [Roseospira marina]MBB4314997.1 general L-amino acid transport system substrate-binding protein [Roseospira marina]MBB5087997.1 general L-amino acid transport system substrate-binding protein [Roseospira marina]